MATLTLTYDARNSIAKKAIDVLLSLGVFNVVPEKKISKAERKTLNAIKEIENGGGTVCNTFEEYLEAIK